MPKRLVGRDAALLTMIEATESGRGVVVSGLPGSGVSALLRAFLDVAGERSWPVAATVAEALARPGPALVVVDDVHLLDAHEAEAIAGPSLTGEVVPVLGATAASATTARLRSTGALVDVEITALADDDIATVVGDVVGAVADGASTRALAADSSGLPGFLVPIVLAALDDGSMIVNAGIARLRGELPLPAAVVDRVAAMRSGLTPEADAVVQATCVGRELPAGAAIEAFGLHALAEAERARLLEHDQDASTVRPAIGAVARVVRSELGSFGVAGVAAGLIETIIDVRSGRRAHWQLLAGVESSPDELVDAASDARQRGELVVAVELASRSWRRGDARGGLLLAEVTAAMGDRSGAAKVLTELLDKDDEPADLLAVGALELATLELWNLGEPDVAVALATDVAELTRGTALEPVGRGALGSVLAYTGRCHDAIAIVGPYLDQGGPGLMLNCQIAATALAVQGACERSAEFARRGLELSLTVDDDPADVDAEIHVVSLALALELGGRLDEAERLIGEWYDRAAHRSVHHAWIALARTRLMLVRGDLDLATRYATEAAAIFGDLDNHAPRRWAVAAHLLSAAQAGDSDTVERRLRELDELGASGVSFLDSDVERARAWAGAALGRLDEARDQLATIAARAEDTGLYALAASAWHDVIRLGGNGEAFARLTALEGKVDGELMRARAAHAGAVADNDGNRVVEAAQLYEQLGASLFAAEAAAQAITLAVHRRERAVARHATALLRDVRPRCRGARTPLLLDVPMAELSPRERDVARLAATGLTSRQIADRLHLSIRTVDNLLQRCYVKLGVSGRHELPGVVRDDEAAPDPRE
jgi:DNA-binding CsgD family transcriptional regulator